MGKNGLTFTAEQCSLKWKSLKDRYKKINDKLHDSAQKRRKTMRPFFEKMKVFCGDDASNTLEHIEEVGAGGLRANRRNAENRDDQVEPTSTKRRRAKITNAESLDRLIDLEKNRERRDDEFLTIAREQKESVTRRNDAIVEATLAFKEVAAAMIASSKPK